MMVEYLIFQSPWILAGIWIFFNARQRYDTFKLPLSWALGVFLFGFVFLPLYLILYSARWLTKVSKSPWEIKTQTGSEFGTQDVSSITALIKEGKIHAEDSVKSSGTDWQPLKESPLMDLSTISMLFNPIGSSAKLGLLVGAVSGMSFYCLFGMPFFLMNELGVNVQHAFGLGLVAANSVIWALRFGIVLIVPGFSVVVLGTQFSSFRAPTARHLMAIFLGAIIFAVAGALVGASIGAFLGWFKKKVLSK